MLAFTPGQSNPKHWTAKLTAPSLNRAVDGPDSHISGSPPQNGQGFNFNLFISVSSLIKFKLLSL
jgi:hypothetical protein